LRDLDVYSLAREQAKTIFVLSRKFPLEEKYSLTDQIRRSSRAVSAMIAEAWARRRYPAAFINKIDEPLGEAMETQVGWITRKMPGTLTPFNIRTWTRSGKKSARC
jgi:four helix bundle protein